MSKRNFLRVRNHPTNLPDYSLLVNVWAPVKATPKSRLPVKVWIYGGSNMAGGIANPTYSGCDSAVDSVVVSINYRVGPLGFLALKGLGLRGNMGIMDQLLGLRWVQDNVDAFGGDPVSFGFHFLVDRETC